MNADQNKTMQRLLGVTADGIAGRGTYAALFRQMGANTDVAAGLGLSASVHFVEYQIDPNPFRIIHFVGQCAHESGNFRCMREIWGPTKQQAGYEGRADLGNTRAGDGKLFMGRSPGMVTGRANYRRVATRMGIDVEQEPQLLERPDLGLWAFCLWWDANLANTFADLDSVPMVSRLVNRGNARTDRPANHEAERIELTAKVRKLVTG